MAGWRCAAGRGGERAMIRRGFWLITGAVLGVTGYRRVTRLGRMLTGQQSSALTTQRAATLIGPQPRAVAGQHRRASPITSLSRTPLALTARTMRPRRGTSAYVARAAAAAGFVRDVREGMAEYRDLHRGESARNLEDHPLDAPTLGSQSDRTSSALSAPGRREP